MTGGVRTAEDIGKYSGKSATDKQPQINEQSTLRCACGNGNESVMLHELLAVRAFSSLGRSGNGILGSVVSPFATEFKPTETSHRHAMLIAANSRPLPSENITSNAATTKSFEIDVTDAVCLMRCAKLV